MFYRLEMFQCSSEQEEMVLVIYEIADNVESHDPDSEKEVTDAARRPEAQHTGTFLKFARPTENLIPLCSNSVFRDVSVCF